MTKCDAVALLKKILETVIVSKKIYIYRKVRAV